MKKVKLAIIRVDDGYKRWVIAFSNGNMLGHWEGMARQSKQTLIDLTNYSLLNDGLEVDFDTMTFDGIHTKSNSIRILNKWYDSQMEAG